MRRLELGLHQILVKLPDSDAPLATAPNVPRTAALKIDALGAAWRIDELTWTGVATVLPPPRRLNRDTSSSIDGLVENSQLHALGLLFYELVNGAPPPAGCTVADRDGDYIGVPILREGGNAVLRRALSLNPRFATDTEFFEALALSLGFAPADLHRIDLSQPAVPISGASERRAQPRTAIPVAQPSWESAESGRTSAIPPAPASGAGVRAIPLRRPRGRFGKRWGIIAAAAILALAAAGGWWFLARQPRPVASVAPLPMVRATAPEPQVSFLLNPGPDWLDAPEAAPAVEDPDEESVDASPSDRDWPAASDSLLLTGRAAPFPDPDDDSDSLRGFVSPIDLDAGSPAASNDAPAKAASSGSPSRPRARAVVHPRPLNFWQRLFGAKPKPRPK